MNEGQADFLEILQSILIRHQGGNKAPTRGAKIIGLDTKSTTNTVQQAWYFASTFKLKVIPQQKSKTGIIFEEGPGYWENFRLRGASVFHGAS